MKRLARARKRSFFFLKSRIVIGFSGLVLSLVAHELYHVANHWGAIESASLFPNSHALFEMSVASQAGHSIDLEEAVAYLITFSVLLVTIIAIWHLTDQKDTRHSHDILFPKDLSQDERVSLLKTSYARRILEL